MTSAPMFLTREEIVALTARVQYAAQRKVLSMMGIEHRTRPDGSVVVLRTHVEQLFGGYQLAAPSRLLNQTGEH